MTTNSKEELRKDIIQLYSRIGSDNLLTVDNEILLPLVIKKEPFKSRYNYTKFKRMKLHILLNILLNRHFKNIYYEYKSDCINLLVSDNRNDSNRVFLIIFISDINCEIKDDIISFINKRNTIFNTNQL